GRSLDAPPTRGVACEHALVALHARVFAVLREGHPPPPPFPAARRCMGFAGPVAGLARQPFRAVARLVQEEAAHPRLRERLGLILVATLADLGPDVSGRELGRRRFLRLRTGSCLLGGTRRRRILLRRGR